jgi:signal transduction histidine kinase
LDSYAQEISADSLRQLLSSKKGADRIQVLNQLATTLRESNQAEALVLSKEADSLAKVFKDTSGQSRALENIGWVYYRQGQWQKSFDFSKNAYDLAILSNNKLQAARLMNNLGALYYEQQNYQMAIQQFRKGYLLATEVNDLATRIRSLNNVAFNFIQTNQLDSAELYANRSINLNQEAGSPYLLSFAYRILGDVYLARAQYDSAISTYQRLLLIAQDQRIKSFEAAILHRLGNAYLLDGNLDKAEPILINAVEFCQENGFLDELAKSHRYLSQVYEQKGELKNAFFHQSRFLVLNDSLIDKSNRDRLALLQGMFEDDLAESELELLKAQNENQAYRLETSRRYIIFFALTAIVVAVLGIRLYLLNKNVRSINSDLLTQQKRIAEQNQALEAQSIQLIEMNETKNKLFSILGHDLRGPVAQVKSVVDMFLAGYLDQKEFDELIKVLSKDIDSVNFTLNNTLKWSMAQMEGFQLNISKFDLREVVANSIKLLEASFKEKNLTVFNQMESHAEVWADQDLIEVVVRNILNNAMKFSNPGDAVTIFSEKDEDSILLFVLDQGVGMSESQVQLLLSDTYSLTKSSLGTQKEKGSGLGLQLAKEFTRRCGGEISIDSHLGHGTKFCIKLPWKPSIDQG